MTAKIAVFWFRRDLRLHDNVALYHALTSGLPVLPIFIFDPEILENLPKKDARVSFIYKTLQDIKASLHEKHQRSLALYHDTPENVFKKLLKNYNIDAVYTNHDYEPYAKERDAKIEKVLKLAGVHLNTYKDQVVFENSEKHLNHLITDLELPTLSLEAMDFEPSDILVPPFDVAPDLIQNYEATRNFPAITRGTSRLGPHLRFGTVSIREMVTKAVAEENTIFWNELIWREFFMQILWHFPHTVNKAFRPKYDRIPWRNNTAEFELWKTGQTGYALVDAGMRELNATGHMHNRVRMLVASFLCKHLLIDWRWGEAYFAEKLLDYELSSNVGNWQWAAGSGVDAAPYFRIFNPITQIDKFDKQHRYINTWVPELQELTYPSKMVDHKLARERCLKVYKTALT